MRYSYESWFSKMVGVFLFCFLSLFFTEKGEKIIGLGVAIEYLKSNWDLLRSIIRVYHSSNGDIHSSLHLYIRV